MPTKVKTKEIVKKKTSTPIPVPEPEVIQVPMVMVRRKTGGRVVTRLHCADGNFVFPPTESEFEITEDALVSVLLNADMVLVKNKRRREKK